MFAFLTVYLIVGFLLWIWFESWSDLEPGSASQEFAWAMFVYTLWPMLLFFMLLGAIRRGGR